MEKDFNGRIIKALYGYTVSHKGKEVARDMLRNLAAFHGVPYEEKTLIDEHNWVSHELLQEINNRVDKIFNDDEITFKIMREGAKTRAFGLADLLFQLMVRPATMYKNLPKFMVDNFNKCSTVKIREQGRNFAVVEFRPVDKYFPTDKNFCYSLKGGFASLPAYLGYDGAQVEEPECSVPLDRKGVINGKFYRVNDQKEVLEFSQGEDPSQVPGKVIGKLSEDGTFKLGGTTYGAQNCVFCYTWAERGLWKRTFGQYFNRYQLLREAHAKLEEERAIIEQKFDEIRELNLTLEQKVRERTAALERSNKLKDLFISIMDHDIKNYLSTVWEYAATLEDNPDSDARRYGAVISRNARRINSLISDARLFSRLQDPQLKKEYSPLDAGQLVQAALQDRSKLISEKKITVLNDLPTGRYIFNGLPLAPQIFANLIDNAVKYSSTDAVLALYAEDGGGRFTVCVKDRGRGIPDEYKQSIFERFERLAMHVTGGVDGSGLGLAIVKALVALHHGRVWVEDNPAGGAIFKVELERSKI